MIFVTKESLVFSRLGEQFRKPPPYRVTGVGPASNVTLTYGKLARNIKTGNGCQEKFSRLKKTPITLWVMPPFHGGNRGSNPLGRATQVIQHLQGFLQR